MTESSAPTPPAAVRPRPSGSAWPPAARRGCSSGSSPSSPTSLLFHRWGTTLPNFSDLPASGPVVVLAAMAGAAVVTLLARWSPIIRGHGIPEAMEAVLDQAEPDRAADRRRQAAVGGDRHRHRRAVRRRGPDHRHRRRDRVAARPGAPRLGQRAQDPARRAARRPAWRRRSARRSPRSCSPSSCCCSSSRRGRSSRSSSPTSVAGGVHAAAVRQRARCSPCQRTASRGLGAAARCSPCSALACGLLAVADLPGPVRGRGRVPAAARRRGLAPDHRRRSSGRRSACSCHAPSASATTSSTTRSPVASRSARSPRSCVGKLVIWWIALGVGHVGRHAGADPLISSCVGGARRRSCSHAPSRARHRAVGVRARRDGRDVRRCDAGARSPRSCSSSSSPATTTPSCR